MGNQKLMVQSHELKIKNLSEEFIFHQQTAKRKRNRGDTYQQGIQSINESQRKAVKGQKSQLSRKIKHHMSRLPQISI